MKKDVIFTQGPRTYSISFNIRTLAELERSIGRSLLFMYSSGGAGMIRQCDIHFTANALKYGLKDIGNRDPYDVIDEYCDNGGTLDFLNGYIFNAITKSAHNLHRFGQRINHRVVGKTWIRQHNHAYSLVAINIDGRVEPTCEEIDLGKFF